jgi:hypothetical protein
MRREPGALVFPCRHRRGVHLVGGGARRPYSAWAADQQVHFVATARVIFAVREFSWLESVSNDGWRLFWQLSENRLHYVRITTTGIVQWVSTFTVSLPSMIAEMPRRPWDAIKIASHPVFLAVSIMAS